MSQNELLGQGDVPEALPEFSFYPQVEAIKDYPKLSLDEYEARLTRDRVNNVSALKQTAVDVAYSLQEKNPELFPEGQTYKYMRSSDVPWLRFADEEIKPLRDQDIVANFYGTLTTNPWGQKVF